MAKGSHAGISRRVFARNGLFTVAGGAVGAGAALGIAALADDDKSDDHTSEGGAGTVADRGGVASVVGLSGWFVPLDWGQSWRQALARARAKDRTAVCAVVGDSVGFGYWSSDLIRASWPGLLRQDLVALAGDGGSGFVGQAHSPAVIFNPGAGVSKRYASVAGNVWQETGTWQSSAMQYGPGAGCVVSTETGATVGGLFEGTQFGVWYLDGGGAFSVEIDGKQVGKISPGGSFAPAYKSFAVPKPSPGQHKWLITTLSLAGSSAGPHISGVQGSASSGVRLDNFSFPGIYSGAWSNQDQWHSGTYAGGWRNPADLVIYELGGNDLLGKDPRYPSGTPAEVWVQQVQTYLDGVMNTTFGGDALGNTDVLFVWPTLNLTGDTFKLFAQYKTYALGIAQSYGAALLDLNALFHGSWNSWQRRGYAGSQDDPAHSGADFFHPSDAGSKFLAAQLTRLISSLT